MSKKTKFTAEQRAQIVTEISLAYLGGGDRITVVLRMGKWLDKYAPGVWYPSEAEMDSLVAEGKAKCRKIRAGFKEGAAEFAKAVCG